jgi:hypothetical protein
MTERVTDPRKFFAPEHVRWRHKNLRGVRGHLFDHSTSVGIDSQTPGCNSKALSSKRFWLVRGPLPRSHHGLVFDDSDNLQRTSPRREYGNAGTFEYVPHQFPLLHPYSWSVIAWILPSHEVNRIFSAAVMIGMQRDSEMLTNGRDLARQLKGEPGFAFNNCDLAL